jgi:hypothetical protein
MRGVNVGVHRTFPPTKLAQALKHLGAVNIARLATLRVGFQRILLRDSRCD